MRAFWQNASNDQLQLLQILGLLREAGADVEVVEIVQVGAFEGRPDFHGLGELSVSELESLWPSRRPLGREALRSPLPSGSVPNCSPGNSVRRGRLRARRALCRRGPPQAALGVLRKNRSSTSARVR